jgi:hypothetical protein
MYAPQVGVAAPIPSDTPRATQFVGNGSSYPRNTAATAGLIHRYYAAGAPRDKITCSSDAGGSIPVFDAQVNGS